MDYPLELKRQFQDAHAVVRQVHPLARGAFADRATGDECFEVFRAVHAHLIAGMSTTALDRCALRYVIRCCEEALAPDAPPVSQTAAGIFQAFAQALLIRDDLPEQVADWCAVVRAKGRTLRACLGEGT